MLFYPAGDQIPGESNLLLIMLTNHQSITLHLCNDSNPITASSDYFKQLCAHILMQSRKPQASKGKKSTVAPPCQYQGGPLVGWHVTGNLGDIRPCQAPTSAVPTAGSAAQSQNSQPGLSFSILLCHRPTGLSRHQSLTAKVKTELASVYELRLPEGEKGCHARTGGLGLEREGADSASLRVSGWRFVQDHRTLPHVPHILCHEAYYRREERLQ